MPITKSPLKSLFISRKLVMPEHINPNGSLFGGVLMSWIDSVAYMSAQRHALQSHVVTVNMDALEFKHPIKVGEHVILTSRVEFVGNSSMEIRVQVEKETGASEERSTAATAFMTFVALDGYGQPTSVPKLKLETLEDHHRNLETRIRIKVRKRLRDWLDRNTTKILIESERLAMVSS